MAHDRRAAVPGGDVADLFISYKSEDRARLQPLIAALEADGIDLWWDAHIGGGTAWRDTIEEELGNARCVLVVWSKGSVGSEGSFVRDEATRALRRGVYLPVRIDPVEPPLGFGETQALSLMGWKGDRSDGRYTALRAAIQAVVDGKQRPTPVAERPGRGVNRRLVLGGGAAMAVAAGAGGWWLTRTSDEPGRMAVLPFANLSGDPGQAYLGDGIAEELRVALSRIPGFQVVSRLSSETVRGLDAGAAASRLNVTDILAGSIRRSGDLVRVTAQLINGRTGVERWSESYDRQNQDVLQIQSDIARRVASALSASLAPDKVAALTKVGTSDVQAHDLVLRARELNMSRDGQEVSRQALSLAQAAVALDPRYVDALVLQAGLMADIAVFYTSAEDQQAALTDAAEVAHRAIALRPNEARAYSTLGFLRKSQLDFRAAIGFYRRASALGEDASAAISYSFFLTEMGFTREGLEAARRAIALDPLNASAISAEGNAFYYSGDYPAAIASLRRMLKAAPDRFYARYFIGLSLMWLKRFDEAMAEYRGMPADDIFRNAGEAILGARRGDRVASDRALAVVEKAGATLLLAAIRAQRGEIDASLTLLEQAWAERSPDVSALRADPLLTPLRSEPRFRKLVAAINFPATLPPPG